MRTGVVYEHELALGQRFKNHYESTKFQAEVWVRQQMDRVPTTIYRPAIVVGDSQTGETQKFDGPYYMLRVISRSTRLQAADPALRPRGRDVQRRAGGLRRRGDAARARAGARATRCTWSTPSPSPASEIFDTLAEEYAGSKTAYRLPPKAGGGLAAGARRAQALRGRPAESIQYLNHPVRFDTRRAERAARPQGLRCPQLEEYVGPMVRFFREHEDDPSPSRPGRGLRG